MPRIDENVKFPFAKKKEEKINLKEIRPENIVPVKRHRRIEGHGILVYQ
ncbi:hypothetical protein IB211_03135c [Intestinimonas butyriciproducens]|uniref:Uncharacterized protein n=1 Tax=Intestinimonas butyriciproducens TaxID=1297617 RepID=A0A0S2W854_9FIRM|nr:hypothetical protein IB211_03135c [Intestinimonas butyriciproducens]